jgi:hypothetical protein
MAVLYKQGRFTIAPAGAMCRNWAMTYEAVSAAHTAQNTSNERRIHEAPLIGVIGSSCRLPALAMPGCLGIRCAGDAFRCGIFGLRI